MNPLPDRVVIVSLAITVLLCFAVALWTARLTPSTEEPLLWRTSPAPAVNPSQPASPRALPPDGV
ncbi:MAG: hypothetical protein ACK52U_00320 [Synechococcaceae cyanobacterium]|jgi:hypothetical protein